MKKAFVISNTSWHFEDAKHIEQLEKLLEKFKNEYPNFTFIFQCNTLRQLDLFKEKDINAVFCNNNCFIDEKIFFPLPDTKKKYDAVYDASFVKFKRHFLASEIENLAQIYAQNYLNDFEGDYIGETQKLLSRAHSFNHSKTGKYQILQSADINRYLNDCRVGFPTITIWSGYIRA